MTLSAYAPDIGAALLANMPQETRDQQLTQTRVPLEEANAAYATPHAAGRLPIVILPDQPLRIRNELVSGGIIDSLPEYARA